MQIEKNVPVAPKSGLTDILRKLDVGDSFLYKADKRTSVAPTANNIGIKVTTKKISDTEVRVWRIA